MPATDLDMPACSIQKIICGNADSEHLVSKYGEQPFIDEAYEFHRLKPL